MVIFKRALMIVALSFSNYVLALEEYGIVIIPEEKCTLIANSLNIKVARNLHGVENPYNKWHITLFHFATDEKHKDMVWSSIKALDIKQFELQFTDFYSTADRWFDWGVESNEILQNIHEQIVYIAAPYHKRLLARVSDIYDQLDNQSRDLADKYGVTGILNSYKPHMTLFYTYPKNVSIRKIPELIQSSEYKNIKCKADKIALGKLGYNGNNIEILNQLEINR